MTCLWNRVCVTLIFTATLFVGTATWAAERESRPLGGPASAIKLVGPIDVEVSQGELKEAEIEGNAKLRARVVIENQGGEVTISLSPRADTGLIEWWGEAAAKVRVRLVLPTLNRVLIKGSGDVTLGRFNLGEGELRLEIEGSGDIKAAQLQAKALHAKIHGSGDIDVGGAVDALKVAIAGSGDFNGEKLRAVTSAVSIKGSGDAVVWATGTLAVTLLGSGDVHYVGRPAVTRAIRGSGEVRPLEGR